MKPPLETWCAEKIDEARRISIARMTGARSTAAERLEALALFAVDSDLRVAVLHAAVHG